MEETKVTLNDSLTEKFGPKFAEAAPKLSLGFGIVLVLGGLYFTWRAGRKHDELVDDIQCSMDEVRELRPEPIEAKDENDETVEAEVSQEGLTMPEYQKKLAVTCLKNGLKVAKVWGPAMGCVGVGLYFVGKSFFMMNQRLDDTNEKLSNLAAAYTLLSNGYSAYRKKIRDEYGEAVDNEFAYGIKETYVEEPEFDKNGNVKVDKNGEVKTKKKKEYYRDAIDPSELSPYAVFFDSTCPAYRMNDNGRSDDIYNEFFIDETEKLMNIRLHANRIVFLNELYSSLQTIRSVANGKFRDARTSAGQINGWTDNGEGVVITKIPYRDNNGNLCYVLDFNVQGPVIDYLDY